MSVDTKYGEAIFKQTQEVAEMFKAAMPKITTNKNGYEIRTKVLEMAQRQRMAAITMQNGVSLNSLSVKRRENW